MSAPHRFTLAQAQALLPAARERGATAARIVDELRLLQFETEEGAGSEATLLRSHELELALDEVFAWFEGQGIQVKHLGPVLLDFPARARQDGQPVDVLLCWRDDEDAIGYYHGPQDGYRTRRPVALLDEV
ncbi:MAG: DUF2203 family protein [Nitriliruptor sp.]|nr:MAG: DUF2203 family protein [Nitriliruptor sp.]